MIQVMIGPPCSGKTTDAKRRLKKDKNTVRVNRDDLRYMLRNEGMVEYKLEKAITKLQDKIVDDMLELGYKVIIDNTHCRIKYLKELEAKYVERCDMIVSVSQAPLWLLKVRNVYRYLTKGIWIPTDVIERMYENCKEVIRYIETVGQ